MKYLTLEDLTSLIKKNVIDDLSENNYNLLNQLEDIAVSEVDTYIGFKFDTDAALKANNQFLKMLVMDIFNYHFNTRMTHTQMPMITDNRYKDAKQLLKDISFGKIVPNLPMNQEEVDEFVSKNYYMTDKRINSQW